MSIFHLDLNTYQQDFKTSQVNKERYGDVRTDFALVNKILDLLPQSRFENPRLKWLDPCAGTGYFTIILYKRLFKSLQTVIKNPMKRHRHIVRNMIWMIEINGEHLDGLFQLFGENANILNGNFLDMRSMEFDTIIGNPPFNCNGIKKVPTNSSRNKKLDGRTVWVDFVTYSMMNLKNGGYLAMITPSIWMKRDHYHSNSLQKWNIKKIHCLTNTQTNRIFHKQAQTPTCYFTIVKEKTALSSRVALFDSFLKNYINFSANRQSGSVSFPLYGASIIEKLADVVKQFGFIQVTKTSIRPGYKGLTVKSASDENHVYPNVSTCVLNKLRPTLVVNFSNQKCVFAGVPKLILAHKMYGFPFYDSTGEYGISNRDNYVIVGRTHNDFLRLKRFLSTKLAFVAFESTRYRMKYLERYAFEFLPDITKIPNFPETITDETVMDYFKFSELERKCIDNIVKKQYKQFQE